MVGEVVHVVSQQDTAVALGSGDVPVLGTPRVVALVEEACVAAVQPALADGETTVGMLIEIEHLHPSAVGAKVVAHARLTDVEGRRLEFAVGVSENGREVARGRVVRSMVDRDRFLSRVADGG
jgi:fluoroacetyl-CoA thioesterase